MNTPAPAHSHSRHIPSLDGLRGMAILLVIAYHYYDLPLGWSGVDLFFVLSGYLITGRLLDTMHTPGYFRTFYRNRILRIFPLYYGVLLAFFAGIHFLTRDATQPLLSFYFQHWISFLTFTQNFSFIIYGMPIAPYLLHFWSLAVEEQFYLVWPFLLSRWKNSQARLKVLIALPLLILVIRCLFAFFYHWESKSNGPFYYYNTFFRIDTILIGGLLCQIHYAGISLPGKLITALLLFCLLLLGISPLFFGDWDSSNMFFKTIGYTIIAIGYACLLHKTIPHKTIPTRNGPAPNAPATLAVRFFSLPGLRYLGRISYGLYIFHLPIYCIFQQRLNNWILLHLGVGKVPMRILSDIGCLSITFLLAMGSFRYFESFFLRLKKK